MNHRVDSLSKALSTFTPTIIVAVCMGLPLPAISYATRLEPTPTKTEAPSSPSENRAEKPGEKSTTAEKLKPKLVSPGDEPRRPVRFNFKAGAEQQIDATTNYMISAEAASKTFRNDTYPMLIAPVTAKIARLKTVDKCATVDIAFGNPDVIRDNGTPLKLTEDLERAAKLIKGVTASRDTGYRGQWISSIAPKIRPDAPAKDARAAAELLSDISIAMNSLSLEFPVESIGKGAKWQFTWPSNFRKLPFDMTSTVTCTSLDDAKGEFTIETTGGLKGLNEELGDVTWNIKAYTKAFKVTAKGKVTQYFSKPLPTVSDMSVNVNMDMLAELQTKAGETGEFKFRVLIRLLTAENAK